MSSEVFVGDSRKLLVDGLVSVFEDIRELERPSWVSLEAPSGWGKTRVGRELYARLAARQSEPQYWPDKIKIPDRKAVEPEDFTRPAGALPEYFWWGISCSPGQGSASEGLEDFINSEDFKNHKIFLNKALKKMGKGTGLQEMSGDILRKGKDFVKEEGKDALFGRAKYGLDALALAWNKFKIEKFIKNPTDFGKGGNRSKDIVENIVKIFDNVITAGFPLVILVEDIHDAGDVLLELLNELLKLDGSLLVVTTGRPERIENVNGNRQLANLMQDHADRLCRVKHTEASGCGFPEGAGLMYLEEDARREILRSFFPQIEPNTLQELLNFHDNPLSLELICNLYQQPEILAKYSNANGQLQIPPKQIAKLSGVNEIYQELWSQLSKEVRISLAVARIITPASINVDTAGCENLWSASVLCDVLENLPYDSVEVNDIADIRDALESDTKPLSWVRTVDDYLRAFVEAPQMKVADKFGVALLEDSLEYYVDDARHEILKQLAKTLLSESEWDAKRNVARCTIALHAEGYIRKDDVAAKEIVAKAIIVLLEGFLKKPRELRERIRLYEQYRILNATGFSDHDSSSIYYSAASDYFAIGKYDTAIDILKNLITDIQGWSADPEVIAIFTYVVRLDLAYFLGTSNRIDEAVVVCRDLLADPPIFLKDDADSVHYARGRLAFWLTECDQIQEAYTHFRELRADNHHFWTRTVPNRYRYAYLLIKDGRIDDSNDLLELLGDEPFQVGFGDPEIFDIRGRLAFWIGDTGDISLSVDGFRELIANKAAGRSTINVYEAVSVYESMLADRRNVNESVTTYREVIAELINASGTVNVDEAVTVYAKLLTGRRNVSVAAFRQLIADEIFAWGTVKDSRCFVNRNRYADILGMSDDVDDVDESISVFRELLADRCTVLGDDHRDTLKTRASLAKLL